MTSPTPAPVRLPITGGRQLTVRLNQSGQAAAVVLGIGGGPVTQALGQAALNAFWASFRTVIYGGITCVGGVYRDVSTVDGLSFDLAAPPAPAGGQSGPPAIAAASYLVRWKTAQGGRSARGRTFLPGVMAGELGTDGRTVGATVTGQLQTAINAYLAAFANIEGGVAAPVVLSFTKGEDAVIVSGSPAPIVAVQRRRMRG